MCRVRSRCAKCRVCAVSTGLAAHAKQVRRDYKQTGAHDCPMLSKNGFPHIHTFGALRWYANGANKPEPFHHANTDVVRATPNEQYKNTIRENSVVNRELFCRESRQNKEMMIPDAIVFSVSLNKTQSRFVTFVVTLVTPDEATTQPERTNGIRRPE